MNCRDCKVNMNYDYIIDAYFCECGNGYDCIMKVWIFGAD